MKPKQNKRKQPKWKEKLEKDIQYKRSDLSVLSEMEKGAKVNQRQQRRMKRKYNIKDARDIPEVVEQLKQQILAKAQRVRRYLKRGKFFRQNRLFKEDTERLHRELGKKQVNVEKPPPIEEIEAFWNNIWENEKHHDEKAEWIRQQDEMMKNQPTQDWKDIIIIIIIIMIIIITIIIIIIIIIIIVIIIIMLKIHLHPTGDKI